MKYFSGDLILYPSFSKLFFCDERILRPSFLCEGVDHLGQQKFQRMSRGAILLEREGGRNAAIMAGMSQGRGPYHTIPGKLGSNHRLKRSPHSAWLRDM